MISVSLKFLREILLCPALSSLASPASYVAHLADCSLARLLHFGAASLHRAIRRERGLVLWTQIDLAASQIRRGGDRFSDSQGHSRSGRIPHYQRKQLKSWTHVLEEGRALE